MDRLATNMHSLCLPFLLLCSFHAGPEQELYCFGVHGHVVAAGTSGELLLWDRRTGSKAGVLDDTHMDEITQVRGRRRHQAVTHAIFL